jgi:rhodanese-related sulfurtransferase
MRNTHAVLAAALTASLTLAACGGSDDATATTEAPVAAVEQSTPDQPTNAASGIQVVSATDAAATIDTAPADLVILDVRTPEEFAEGHIDGATMLDFYEPTFAEQLATLDPDVPYVLYCRSGNRSGQARSMMAELGFTTVDDIDGGILAWQSAGLPVVTP